MRKGEEGEDAEEGRGGRGGRGRRKERGEEKGGGERGKKRRGGERRKESRREEERGQREEEGEPGMRPAGGSIAWEECGEGSARLPASTDRPSALARTKARRVTSKPGQPWVSGLGSQPRVCLRQGQGVRGAS